MRRLIVVLSMLAIAAALYASRDALAYRYALVRTVRCSDAESPASCARAPVRAMLAKKDGTAIMTDLAPRLPAQQCHYIGHVVGQQSFLKFKNAEAAIAQCDRSCDSACLHGIIGEAFAEKLGLGDPDSSTYLDFAHMSLDEIKQVGSQLCADPETCHGVGHTLFQAYATFTPALAACDAVAPKGMASFCYRGLFMEYADILFGRNMRDVPGVELPKPDALKGLCVDGLTEEQRRSCFHYFPRMAIAALSAQGKSNDEAFADVRAICKGYDLNNRISCIAGTGVYNSYKLVNDPETASKICLAYPAALDQASCNFGMVTVALEERQEKVLAYCASVPDPTQRYDCYAYLYYSARRIGVPEDSLASACADEECRSAQSYRGDPRQLIRAFSAQ